MARKCLGILGAEGEPIKVDCFEPAEHEHPFTDIKTTSGGTTTTLTDALADKAAKATTLAGYGITDAYTKTDVDTALAGKASKHKIEDASASLKIIDGSALLEGKKFSFELSDNGEGAEFDITVENAENLMRALENPDSTPTASSDNLITSGAVASALSGKAASVHTHTTSNITNFNSGVRGVCDEMNTAIPLDSDASSSKANIKSVGYKFAYFLITNISGSDKSLEDLLTCSDAGIDICIGQYARTIDIHDKAMIRCDYVSTTIYVSLLESFN